MKHTHQSPDTPVGFHTVHARYRPGNYANLVAGKHRLTRH